MKISLITPVWNNAETIGHCIRSINQQTRKCQHILVDGASTDDTLQIIEQERGPDSIVISEPDQGMYDAINKGIELADGEIIGVLNSDDFYPRDDVLELVIQAFEDPEVDACYSDLLYVARDDTDKIERTWRSGSYRRKRFLNGWMPPHPTLFLRKVHYDKFGGYRLDLGSAADYELMLRMLFKHQLNAKYIPSTLVHMRNQGMSNISLKNRIKANRNDRKAWEVNGVKARPWTLLAKPLGKIGQWLK